MRKRDYLNYVNDILNSIADITAFTRGLTFSSFKDDKKTVYAVVRCVEIIEQASQRLPKDLKDKYPAIPWMQFTTLGNKLSREHFQIDVDFLWQTIREDFPYLSKYIQGISLD